MKLNGQNKPHFYMTQDNKINFWVCIQEGHLQACGYTVEQAWNRFLHLNCLVTQ